MHFPFWLSPISLWIIVFILGMLVGFLFFFGWSGWNKFKKHNQTNEGDLTIRQTVDGAFDIFLGQAKRNWVTASIVIIMVVVFLITFSNMISSNQSSKLISDYFCDSPGGIFGLVTGVLTALGTLVAIQTILEMKHTITSYPQLHDRLAELIEEADDSNEGTRIISYSPLPGFWQVKSNNLKDGLENKLCNQQRKIQIICLEEMDHLKLLLTIARKRHGSTEPKTAKDINEFQEQCNSLLISFSGKEQYHRKQLEEQFKKKEKFISEPIRLPWDKIPPYYFFVSDHKAIIVTPVGLPNINDPDEIAKDDEILLGEIKSILENGKQKDSQKTRLEELLTKFIISNSKKSSLVISNKAHVETLGFETNDRSIIQKLQSLFDETKAKHLKSIKILESNSSC